MKNKRQLKAEKSQRQAKAVAKKFAAEISLAAMKNKSRKQAQIEETESCENEVRGKKLNKQAKRIKAEKDQIQTTVTKQGEKQNYKTDAQNTRKMPDGTQLYEEPKVQDIQRYLETLPSPEIRHFIEGLIAQDKFNMLTVDVAAAVGDIDRMRYYFMRDPSTGKSRFDPNGRCLDGGTPLHAAIKAKHKESVQLLIENGADLSLVDFMGDNAIMAAIKAGVANMINLLWPYKANLDVNHENTMGKTALHLATERSWEGCVRFLLSNHACPNVKDRDLVTPLMIACSKADVKIVDSLIKAGADISIEDADFDTAVSRALRTENQQVLDCLMKSLDANRRQIYVKDLVYNVMNPPLPEPEYALMEAQYIPMLTECTKHPEFRDSFYDQRVINTMVVRMKHREKQFDSLMQIGCLILNVFFRFGSEIDIPLVRQFFSSGAPRFIMRSVQSFGSEYNTKSTIYIFFPMIGLVEIPEGRSWIWKNILEVSEYFNHFDKDQLDMYLRDDKLEWFLENAKSKEINRVWIHFNNEVNRMQTEHREKHMIELLQQEELDRCKKEKRQERIRQKREEKMRRFENDAAAELLESWSAKALSDDEQSDDEDSLNTCRNTNAIVGSSSEAIADPTGASDSLSGYINISSQPLEGEPNNAFKWADHQFDHLKKENEYAWTTVQTKKNKEKERQSSDRQSIARPSPKTNSKRKKTTVQKHKKKKDGKQVQMPLNVFTTPLSVPVIGATRWADVAKGVVKKTPHLETNDSSFPKPETTINAQSMTEGLQNNNIAAKGFPQLRSHQEQLDRKEKPSKMTFHFHAEQPECDSDSQGDIFDEDTIDVEEAEKELQVLETSTGYMKEPSDEGAIKEKINRPSQSSECFMCDPEYTNDTKGRIFDPTKLTDEEISSLNTRGKVSVPDGYLTISNTSQWTESETNLKYENIDVQKANGNYASRTNNQQWMKNIEMAKIKEVHDDLLQAGFPLYYEGNEHVLLNVKQKHTSESSTHHQPTMDKDATYALKPVHPDQINHQTIDFGSGGLIPPKISNQRQRDKKTCATISVDDISYQKTGDTKSLSNNKEPYTEDTFRTASGVDSLSEADRQLLKHQTDSYTAFEEILSEHESEHFIELVVSLSPISEPRTNIIDDLFKSPEEIPEWINEEEEIPNEEEVWNKMTDHSTPIKQSFELDNDQESRSCETSRGHSMNINGSHMDSVPKQNLSPFDLSKTDPAIIHCSKRPEYLEQINVNIACAMTKEYDNVMFKNQQITGNTQLQNHNQDVAFNPEDIANLEPVDDGNAKDKEVNSSNVEKQTAVIKPLGLLYSNAPATNCAFGQKLLQNACCLEHEDKDENFLYPEDLKGENYEADDEQPGRHEGEEDEFYFPSFHQDTMLSAHHNENDVSITHCIQQIQLEQIRDYYARCKDEIAEDKSMDQSKFVYYAQSAGMNKDRIEQHLQGRVDIEQKHTPNQEHAHPVLPAKPGHAQNIPRNQSQGCLISEQQQPVYSNIPRQDQGQSYGFNTTAPVQNVQQIADKDQSSQYYGNAGPNNAAQGMSQQPVQFLPTMPYLLLRPFLPPPSHPANIRNIQSQQAAMSSSVKLKIQEIIESMFKAKAKSIRWRNELARIRNFPPEKLMVVGKIVIPRDDCDRVYIAYHDTGSTILGYLCDGTEVAVKAMDSKKRPIKSDELDKIMSVDNSQPFVNRYRAIEEFNGNYYIAIDLYEYSLPEYLQMIRKDESIDEKIAAEKLVFQLLRGLLTLHQSYLIVHAELRPDNIVIDTDGNLKVAGYGIGRNTERASERYLEYSDEDKCWLAPEVLLHRQAITCKMDIFAVGMLIYYIYKGGKNPFGSEPREIIPNICTQNYMMEYISDEASHLLSMMLSINKIDRPAIADALKHPLFWADEKRLRFVSIVGSDIVWELKHSFLLDKKQRENSMATVVSMAPCNLALVRWMQAIDPVVMKEMKGFRPYKNSLVELVIFVYNCCNHFETLSPKVKEIIDEPCRYFLTKFPTLFMTVYRAIKFSGKKDKTCYKPFF